MHAPRNCFNFHLYPRSSYRGMSKECSKLFSENFARGRFHPGISDSEYRNSRGRVTWSHVKVVYIPASHSFPSIISGGGVAGPRECDMKYRYLELEQLGNGLNASEQLCRSLQNLHIYPGPDTPEKAYPNQVS